MCFAESCDGSFAAAGSAHLRQSAFSGGMSVRSTYPLSRILWAIGIKMPEQRPADIKAYPVPNPIIHIVSLQRATKYVSRENPDFGGVKPDPTHPITDRIVIRF